VVESGSDRVTTDGERMMVAGQIVTDQAGTSRRRGNRDAESGASRDYRGRHFESLEHELTSF
jgi:hypothetical protein